MNALENCINSVVVAGSILLGPTGVAHQEVGEHVPVGAVVDGTKLQIGNCLAANGWANFRKVENLSVGSEDLTAIEMNCAQLMTYMQEQWKQRFEQKWKKTETNELQHDFEHVLATVWITCPEQCMSPALLHRLFQSYIAGASYASSESMYVRTSSPVR